MYKNHDRLQVKITKLAGGRIRWQVRDYYHSTLSYGTAHNKVHAKSLGDSARQRIIEHQRHPQGNGAGPPADTCFNKFEGSR